MLRHSFPQLLQIEKPVLSEVVSALLRKGFVTQKPDPDDRRQRLLSLTPAGEALWKRLPKPIAMMRDIAFEGRDKETLETVVRALRTATERLSDPATDGGKK